MKSCQKRKFKSLQKIFEDFPDAVFRQSGGLISPRYGWTIVPELLNLILHDPEITPDHSMVIYIPNAFDVREEWLEPDSEKFSYDSKNASITVPILVKGYQYKTDQVSGMAISENGALVVKFNPLICREDIATIFGRIEYKVLVSSIDSGDELIARIQIRSWRDVK